MEHRDSFGEVTSVFESWQVLRHSNLYVKLPPIATEYLYNNCVPALSL